MKWCQLFGCGRAADPRGPLEAVCVPGGSVPLELCAQHYEAATGIPRAERTPPQCLHATAWRLGLDGRCSECGEEVHFGPPHDWREEALAARVVIREMLRDDSAKTGDDPRALAREHLRKYEGPG